MKVSNFRGYRPGGEILLAKVDVTTGHLFWRETVTRLVFREADRLWSFADTGEHTPDLIVERLERAYKAKENN